MINLWRMTQFYETYKNHPNLPALLREINRTNNLTIWGRAKSIEEKEFCLQNVPPYGVTRKRQKAQKLPVTSTCACPTMPVSHTHPVYLACVFYIVTFFAAI
jgi:hypothetical protein